MLVALAVAVAVAVALVLGGAPLTVLQAGREANEVAESVAIVRVVAGAQRLYSALANKEI